MTPEESEDLAKIKFRQKQLSNRVEENNSLIFALIEELRSSRNNKVKGLKWVMFLQISLIAAYFIFLKNTVSAGIILGIFAMTMNLRFFSYKSAGKESVGLTNRIKHWLRLDKVEEDDSDTEHSEKKN